MTIWWLILILAVIISGGIAFIWLASRVTGGKRKNTPDSIQDAADADIEHVFNEDFREELRNRGRLHFEKIISENAMFLQQDLRLTTSQLNDYMKQEISRTLQEEFSKYEQSIADAKQLAIDSIEKTQSAIEEERAILHQNLEKEFQAERERLVKRFEDNMAEIINHYVLDAVGSEIDLNDQLEYILGELQANKAVIVEDIRSGA